MMIQKTFYLLANSDTAGFYLVEINKQGALGNRAITRAISAPKGHDIFRKISEDKGLETAAVLGFVKRFNIKRAVREVVYDQRGQDQEVIDAFNETERLERIKRFDMRAGAVFLLILRAYSFR